jgi:hypothetical protein
VANLPQASSKFVIKSADTYIIGGANESVGTLVVLLVSGSFSGSVTVKARPGSQCPAVVADSVAFTAWWYRTNAGVIATAALAGAGLIAIPSGGLEVALDCTSFVSGTLTAYVTRVTGALA